MANGLSGVAGPIASPAIPSSGSSYTNISGRHCLVTIRGGVVSSVQVDSNVITGVTVGLVVVPSGSSITLTYSVAPAWDWLGL